MPPKPPLAPRLQPLATPKPSTTPQPASSPQPPAAAPQVRPTSAGVMAAAAAAALMQAERCCTPL